MRQTIRWRGQRFEYRGRSSGRGGTGNTRRGRYYRGCSGLRISVSLDTSSGSAKAFCDLVFVAKVEGAMDIAIDDGEIKEHAWLNPEEALRKHAAGEMIWCRRRG